MTNIEDMKQQIFLINVYAIDTECNHVERQRFSCCQFKNLHVFPKIILIKQVRLVAVVSKAHAWAFRRREASSCSENANTKGQS